MNRRGVALVAALLAMLLAGVLAALVLSASRLQWLAGHRLLAGRRAFSAAEGIVHWEVVHWDTSSASLPAGQSLALVSPGIPGPVRSTASLVRLNSSLYLVRAVAEVTDQAGGALAHDGVAQLVGETRDSSPGRGINRIPAGSWWRWP